MKTFTAYIEYDDETGLYIGSIPTVPGVHTQGASIDELKDNLKEVLELCLEKAQKSGDVVESSRFVGLQQIDID